MTIICSPVARTPSTRDCQSFWIFHYHEQHQTNISAVFEGNNYHLGYLCHNCHHHLNQDPNIHDDQDTNDYLWELSQRKDHPCISTRIKTFIITNTHGRSSEGPVPPAVLGRD